MRQGDNPSGKVFFEIGTGRTPLVPLAYWLMGAERIITIDLNPYLKKELFDEALKQMLHNSETTSKLFGSLLVKSRLNSLFEFIQSHQYTLSELLELCQISYVAPGDASNTYLPNESIDYHTSYTVYEHIPPKTLIMIIEEGNRIIKDGGLFINRIDYSDHFAHTDKNISYINFLQYSDNEWKKYAGNRYMYMNRMRHDDIINLFESVGHTILETQTDLDHNILKLLRSGTFKLDERYDFKKIDILATRSAWIISQKLS